MRIGEGRGKGFFQTMGFILSGLCLIYLGPLCIWQVVGHAAWLWQFAAMAGFGVLFTGIYRVLRGVHPPRSRLVRCLLGAMAFAALYLLQIRFVHLFASDTGWDVGASLHAAENIGWGFEDYGYLMRYPNNAFYILFASLFTDVPSAFGLTNMQAAMVYVNVAVVDIAFGVGCLTAKRLLGAKGTKWFVIISLPLYLFSPWLEVPYTDTLSMLFPMLTLFLYLKMIDAKRDPAKSAYAVLMALSGALGYLFKPTAVIMLIAVLLVILLGMHKSARSILKRVLCVTVSCLIVLMMTQASYQLLFAVTTGELTEETLEKTAFPMTHFLMMGLNQERNGVYLESDVQATAAHEGKQAKMAFNLQIVKQRLEAMGLGGYLRFALIKSHRNYGDGTFFFGREGNFRLSEPYDMSGAGKALQAFIYYDHQNPSEPYPILANGLWSLVLLMACLPLFRRNLQNKEAFTALHLCILGLSLFLVLFESRSRYLINHLPLFALMAAQGAQWMGEKLKAKRRA